MSHGADFLIGLRRTTLATRAFPTPGDLNTALPRGRHKAIATTREENKTATAS
ncbi:hypothetical protein ABZ016_07515 [Streptomyces sp. NPDC006372]|uniref:hypothetical protein n=1 Tax=Streptomyces sp. NPDC006372 TaxID=3155599 RepID=UPI0033BE70AD